MKRILIAVTLSFIAFLLSCKKEPTPNSIQFSPLITTDSATDILMYTAHLHGSIKYGEDSIIKVGFCWSTNSTPTINDSVILFPSSKKTFKYKITGLTENVKYYFRSIAYNNYDTVYGDVLEFKTWDGKLKDYDGNEYKCVQVGDVAWMAQNLKSTHYSDGTPIADLWCESNTIRWYGQGHNIMPNKEADMNNDGVINTSDSLIYVETYGLLYTWYSANNLYSSSCNGWIDKKVAEISDDVCPSGWHLPSKQEWDDLKNFILQSNGYNYDSVSIQIKSSAGWNNNNNGIDKYGLNILPAGLWHHPNSTHFITLGNSTSYWTSTEGNSVNGINVTVDQRVNDGFVGKDLYGFSVRCIKNQ